MIKWADPRVAITFALLAIFAGAMFCARPDEQMKAAVINIVIMAIGYWMGSNTSSDRATENTGKAFDAIKAATRAAPDGEEKEKGDEL